MLENYKFKLITKKQINHKLSIADKNTNDQVWACVSQVNSEVKYTVQIGNVIHRQHQNTGMFESFKMPSL